MRKSLIPLVTLLIFSAMSISVFANGSQTLESSDSAGNTVDTFNPGDPVYVKGSGLVPSSSYKIYIVQDYSPWLMGTTSLTDLTIIEGPIDVSTDSNGYITGQPILVWASASPGYYDIFADCQTDGTKGTYDEYDDIDDLDVNDAGFFVIAEVPLGVFAVLTACFVGLGVKRLRLRRKETL